MILGHVATKVSAIILPLLTVALHAGLTTCDGSPRCADYIRAGIGYTSTVIETHIEVATVATQTITVTGGTGAATGDLAAASACSSSWRSYSSRQSKNVVLTLITTTYYQALTTNITYGTGDVYSTAPGYGIPIASNNFTATSTKERVLNITSTSVLNVQRTLNKTLASATPKCSLITPGECSKLYASYVSSLGLPKNASVPDITPAPANSPPCPTYYYQPFSSCSKSLVTSYPNDCTIMGNSVKLFYFPSQTEIASSATEDIQATITDPPLVVYEYAPGTTFTSPSIYLKFDYLSAERLSQGNDAAYCSICDKNGCRETGVDGGQQRNVEGTSIEGQLVTLAPEKVSSIVLNYNEQEASSIVSTMALGLPGYADVMNDIVGNFNVTARPLRLQDVLHPPPEAYYLQPLDNAPGCGLSAPQPQCSTIYEGAYRALISLPSEVTGFQGPWKSCLPVIYGIYDPPIALTKASTADGPTLPGGGGGYRTSTNGGQAAQTPQTAVPENLPNNPAAQPTALPDQNTGQNGNGGNGAGPTLPVSGGGSNNNGVSSNGGTNSGGAGNGANSGNNNGGAGNANNNNAGGTGSGDTSDSRGGGSSNENSGESSGGNSGGSSQGNNGGTSNGSGGSSSGNNEASSNNNNGGDSANNGGGFAPGVTEIVLPGATLRPGSEAVVSGTTYSLLPTEEVPVIVVNGKTTSLPSAEAGIPLTLPNGVVATVGGSNNNGGPVVYVDSSGSARTATGATTYVDSHGSTHTVASRTTTRRPTGTGAATPSNGESGTAIGTASLASSASPCFKLSGVVLWLSAVLLVGAHGLVT